MSPAREGHACEEKAIDGVLDKLTRAKTAVQFERKYVVWFPFTAICCWCWGLGSTRHVE
jgi:hypothetical protein